MVVNKLCMDVEHSRGTSMNGDDLEVRQNGMGRWLWDVVNVRNDLGARNRMDVLLKREKQRQR